MGVASIRQLPFWYTTATPSNARYDVRQNRPRGHQVDGCLVQSLMNILDCYFEEFRPFEGVVKKSPEAAENLKQSIEPMFMFALVWSILATVDRKGREFMDQFLR